MQLSINVKVTNDDGQYKEETIEIAMRNLESMKSMTARTLMVETPQLVSELFDPDREWVDPPKPAPEKKPAQKKSSSKTAKS